MRRICIVGSPGSGKSTLAKKLGSLMGIEVIHLDKLFWKPGWNAVSNEELADLQDEHLRKDSWIIDGSYSSVWQPRLERADTIIFLDFFRWICIYRVVKRYVLARNQTRSDMGSGCPEKIDFPFLLFVWNYPTHRRNKVLAMTQKYTAQKQIIILRNDKKVSEFLKNIKQGNR
ncbi:DNA topology modulation protein [Shimazuella sp. AN120528]|uniref:DNA topology modulation protein n=1 Tax=Shimazuella soli TaxID=1892854 RepID=UPI001F0EE2D9|nr:DNA topology modulation protein [Shimazuella soli]MCH5585734.1 DNA topology modulation protein [Shimazuella soli]